MLRDELIQQIQALDAVVADWEQGMAALEARYPGAELPRAKMELYRAEKRRLEERAAKNFPLCYGALEASRSAIDSVQPPLEDIAPCSGNTAFPPFLRFGRYRLYHKSFISQQNPGGRFFMPRLLPFPLIKPIWGPFTEIFLEQMHGLLLRLLADIPAGKLEITAADPYHLGESFAPFKTLFPLRQLFPHERVLTNAGDIERMLGEHTTYCEGLIQNAFAGSIQNWAGFNRQNPDRTLPYKVTVLVGVPEQISDKSMVYAVRLLTNGPRCGVLPIFLVDKAACEDSQGGRKYGAFFDAIAKSADLFEPSSRKRNDKTGDAIGKTETGSPLSLKAICVTEEEEQFPGAAVLQTFIAGVKGQYAAAANAVRTVEDLVKAGPLWEGDSSEGIEAPVGWDKTGNVVNFVLNDAPPHALLGGASGTGKSNLLHVMIQSLCQRYSPEELHLYLMDFKEGVEFHLYASSHLPQAKMISENNDPEYGVSVLVHLEQELKRRLELFKAEDGVKDFVGYREIGKKLPRILVIIDEFQVLLEHKEAPKHFDALQRQGRSAGIHLLLATQTLAGLANITSGTQFKSSLGCRIALSCNAGDSAIILDTGNDEAAKLEKKKEAIINTANGQKEGNRIFVHPKADPAIGKKYAAKFAAEARKRGYSLAQQVHSGDTLPELPDSIALERTEGLVLELGEQIAFGNPILRVVMPNSYGGNLLIAGVNPRFHDGLLASIKKSAASQVDEIVTVQKDSLSRLETIRAELESPAGPQKRLLLIADELQDIRDLRPPKPVSPAFKKDGAAPSPGDHFQVILEEGPEKGIWTVVLSSKWPLLTTFDDAWVKGICFNLRIAYKLGAAQADQCINGSSGSGLSNALKELESLAKDDRACFKDRENIIPKFFRPYVVKEG